MLSYPVEEAETLLQGKLSSAQKALGNCEEDLDFLREQITVCLPAVASKDSADCSCQTLEVATARVYNWDVTMKRKEKAEFKEVDSGEKCLPNG